MGLLGLIFGPRRAPTNGYFTVGASAPLPPREFGLYAVKESYTSSIRLVDELVTKAPSDGDCFFLRAKEKPRHLIYHHTFALLSAYKNYLDAANQIVVGQVALAFKQGISAGFEWMAAQNIPDADFEKRKPDYVRWSELMATMYSEAMAVDTRARFVAPSQQLSQSDEKLTKFFVENIVRSYDDDNSFVGRGRALPSADDRALLAHFVSHNVSSLFNQLDKSVRFVPTRHPRVTH